MILKLAEHYGFCFGVRDALKQAEQLARQTPLTILGELVHNETVLSELRDRGIRIVDRTEAVETAAVMITAHGASDKLMNQVRERPMTLTWNPRRIWCITTTPPPPYRHPPSHHSFGSER